MKALDPAKGEIQDLLPPGVRIEDILFDGPVWDNDKHSDVLWNEHGARYDRSTSDPDYWESDFGFLEEFHVSELRGTYYPEPPHCRTWDDPTRIIMQSPSGCTRAARTARACVGPTKQAKS